MRKENGNNFLTQVYKNVKAENYYPNKSPINNYWREYPYDIGELHFPRDEGKHNFKHEWWYINLHLTNEINNDKYDVMVSYFPKQEKLPIPMRMFMITDEQNKTYLPGKKHHLGLLYSSDKKQDIRFRKGTFRDRWFQINSPYAFQYAVNLDAGRYGLNVAMRSNKPPLPVGGNGYVPIGEGGYSYYYSLTNLNVSGFLKVKGKRIPVIGKGWVDHQFGDYNQTNKVETYEWFSIQLDNNVEIICWYAYVNGVLTNPIMTYMLSNSKVEVPKDFNIEILDYWTTPRLKKYSSKWRITEPERNLDITVTPVIPNQLSYIPYPFKVGDGYEIYLIGLYEGSTKVTGKYDGKPVKGVGFAELTHTHK